jgi:hypothetical protein
MVKINLIKQALNLPKKIPPENERIFSIEIGCRKFN